MLTGVGAVVNTARVTAGSSVAVIGLGGVGLAALLGAIAAGAERVIAVDLSTQKLDFARQLGATDSFEAGPNAAERIREATRRGVEFALEMAGSVKALELAYRVTRRGGTTVTAGLQSGCGGTHAQGQLHRDSSASRLAVANFPLSHLRFRGMSRHLARTAPGTSSSRSPSRLAPSSRNVGTLAGGGEFSLTGVWRGPAIRGRGCG